MTRSIRIAMLLVLVIALSGLVLGVLVPPGNSNSKASPYLSALSDLSVKPAYAIVCNTICFRDAPHHFVCITDLEAGNLACSPSADHTSCVNLDLCQ
jgi:hypothetical protein